MLLPVASLLAGKKHSLHRGAFMFGLSDGRSDRVVSAGL